MPTALEPVPTQMIRDLLGSQHVKSAFRFFEDSAAAITEEQGLTDTTIDNEGNCLALFRGASLSPLLVVSAHLDTVFSSNTNFTITEQDNRLFGPGISDDG